jgi:glyoxylase-like metal-dependent hydrolase (beta-lactamase superfamily II)
MSAALEWVVAPNPSPMTLEGTRTYIVGRERPVVIDPGPSIPSHVEEVARRLAHRSVSAVIVTHAHADHAGAAVELARRIGSDLWMARGAFGAHDLEPAVDFWCGEGDTVRTDSGELRIVATPGHTPDHVCVHWSGGAAPPGGALFVGDLLLGEGATTLIAAPEGDVGLYLASLERIEELGADVLYPAHGDPLRLPAEAIARYRRHRVARIEQVREILQHASDLSRDRVVERIYGSGLDPRLHEAAAASVEAMVRYLRRIDGRPPRPA